MGVLVCKEKGLEWVGEQKVKFFMCGPFVLFLFCYFLISVFRLILFVSPFLRVFGSYSNCWRFAGTITRLASESTLRSSLTIKVIRFA